MKSKRHKRALQVALHTSIITIVAVLLSNTLVYRLTSMLAFKSSVEVKDYQISDLYVAVEDMNPQKEISDNVVIIAVDGLCREQIAEVINIVNAASPTAIGVDLIFPYLCSVDSTLISALSAPNIIMAAEKYDDTTMSTSYFSDIASKFQLGIVNLDVNTPVEVVRTYRNQYFVNDSSFYSFATLLAVTSGHNQGCLDTGSVYIYYPSLDFWVLSHDMLVEQPEVCKEIMKNRIVIIGDLKDKHDKHLTPIGDTTGLWIQACITETIVGKHTIKQSPSWLNWTIAVISCILIILFKLFLSDRKKTADNLLFRLVQILVIYLYFLFGSFLFDKYSLCVDFAPSMSTIAVGLLAYDLYNGFISIHKKIKNKKSKW